MTGSTRVARQAGRRHAAIETTVNSNAIIANVTGSVGVIPTSILSKR